MLKVQHNVEYPPSKVMNPDKGETMIPEKLRIGSLFSGIG